MSAAQFSVKWVHRNPVLVTGFVNTAVDWLAVIFQIISDGRILSNPLRSVEPKEIGQSGSFEWIDRNDHSEAMEDFWNDILCPAAVSEEAELYYTRSRWLSQFPLWPGPLAISDFRGLMLAPWLTENFDFKSVVIVPSAHMFVNDMYYRRKENRSVIRLENLEPLVRAYPETCPIPFDELLAIEHTTGKFAAAYAILNKWFALEAKANADITLFPYEALARYAHESVEHLSDILDLRMRNKVGEALKAVRISYNGFNYQKIPHSPKDPEGWRTSLHPGQVEIVDSVLQRMDCPIGGVADWRPSEEQLRKMTASEGRGRRRSRSGGLEDQTPQQVDLGAESESPEMDSRIEYDSNRRSERRSSRQGGSGRSSSRGSSSRESSGGNRDSSRRRRSDRDDRRD